MVNLEDWKLRQLLIDIEDAEGRQAADFLTICNQRIGSPSPGKSPRPDSSYSSYAKGFFKG